ncbi:unnamed protein product [Rotaria sp. Silwood2]|nr:unnamed protein product [Rotaria sp. Silwood2]CAF2741726.1 unnamed protein product [Rotaria sp. Silwood2]CAF3868840.1 unnamed protein product [Rotaria sp. Silwood2]CAF4039812.1 unnamed protein product [Rotaria sp. Silwood2]CAF4130283.1 unnamed protein product [Rotaria sp. Silwood2]
MSDNIDNQKSLLIWLDDSNSDSQENVIVRQELCLLNSNFKMFQTKNECEEYIKSQSADVHITLIVNGRLGHQLVPNIHDLPQIIAIYVYCMNQEEHKKWALNFAKVKGVLADFNDLRRNLQPSHTDTCHYSIVSELPTTDTTKTVITQIESTYELDDSYFISDTCFDCFVRMKMDLTEKDDFVSLCQDALQRSENLLPILREFQEGYDPNQAIFWLYRHPFFHVFIDNMFKLAHIDSMLPCRFFIHDIHKQFEQHKCTSTIEVYKSEIISKEKFQKLNSFNGKIIAMKSFFLGSTDRNTALLYMPDISSSNEYQRILFIIEANPQIENVKLFAKISSLTKKEDPNDVLFMIGSLFKITEIQNEQDGVINIKMSLCGNDTENPMKALFDQVKLKYMNDNRELDAIDFGQILFEIGHSLRHENISDRGEKYIVSYAEKLPNDHPDRLRCYDALGNLNLQKGNLESRLNWLEKSFNIKKERLQPNDPNLIDSYQNLALGYLHKKDFTQALDYFTQLLGLLKQLYGDDHTCLTFCYNYMANIYENEQRFLEAISCYYQSLSIMTKNNVDDIPSFAAIYNNLGKVYTCLEYHHLALGFYKTSLEMKLKYLQSVHPSIAITYQNIGLVYECMNDIQQARENLEKAVNIYRQSSNIEQSCITEIEEIIRNLPTSPT